MGLFKKKPKQKIFPDIEPSHSFTLLHIMCIGGWKDEMDIEVELNDNYISQTADIIINMMNKRPDFAKEILSRIKFE